MTRLRRTDDVRRFESFPVEPRSGDNARAKAFGGDPFQRPTGQDTFDAMTKEEQDTLYGEEVAQALRDGKIQLSDLVEKDGGFIRRKPQQDLNL